MTFRIPTAVLWAALVAAVTFVAVAVVVATRPGFDPAEYDRQQRQKALDLEAQIRPGMSAARVDELLGRPENTAFGPPMNDGRVPTVCEYYRHGRFVVAFGPDGRVLSGRLVD